MIYIFSIIRPLREIGGIICIESLDTPTAGGAHHEQHIEFPKGDPPDMSVGTHIRVLHQCQLISMKKKYRIGKKTGQFSM